MLIFTTLFLIHKLWHPVVVGAERLPYPISNPCRNGNPIRFILMCDGAEKLRTVDILRVGRFVGKVVESLPGGSSIAFIQNTKPTLLLNLKQYADLKDDRVKYTGWINNPHGNKGLDLADGVVQLTRTALKKTSKNIDTTPLVGLIISNGYSVDSLSVVSQLIKQNKGHVMVMGLPTFDVRKKLEKYASSRPYWIKTLSSYYSLDNHYVDMVLQFLCPEKMLLQLDDDSTEKVMRNKTENVSTNSKTGSGRTGIAIQKQPTSKPRKNMQRPSETPRTPQLVIKNNTVAKRPTVSMVQIMVILKKAGISLPQMQQFLEESGIALNDIPALLKEYSIDSPAQLFELLETIVKPIISSEDHNALKDKATVEADFLTARSDSAINTGNKTPEAPLKPGSFQRKEKVKSNSSTASDRSSSLRVINTPRTIGRRKLGYRIGAQRRDSPSTRRGRTQISNSRNGGLIYNYGSCKPDFCKQKFGLQASCLENPSVSNRFYCRCGKGFVFDSPFEAKSCSSHRSGRLRYTASQWKNISVSIRDCSVHNRNLNCRSIQNAY